MTTNSSSVKLASLVDKTTEQISAQYHVTKDVSYGADKEQTMDIYLSNDAEKLNDKNYTVVFLHGGGYYLSDKSSEERYIQPYLKKGMNVINMNYRIKRGIPIATEDLPNALNFLKSHNSAYSLDLDRIILTGFSAGAHIVSMVAVAANNPEFPMKLAAGISISGVINFSGPVDGLDVVEQGFINNEVPIMQEIGLALFPVSADYTLGKYKKYEPITYFDENDPPFFIWHGGNDDQIPAVTFKKFVDLLQQDQQKNVVLFVPEGLHSPSESELQDAYQEAFTFLDKL